MNNFVIQTHDLNHSFGSFKAVDKVNINVPENSIYCFLGPNGAGKSTTIRLLLGLYDSNPNTIDIFGKKLNRDKLSILEEVGAMVEAPSLYHHLSGKDNLEVTRVLRGVEKQRIGEVLKIVGLSEAANKKVKNYSMGMKQRLGLAIALLSNPKLLILDEPSNGLDPQGIKEFRELLISLQRNEGVTIFLSSHILSEVEKLATHVGIIHKGALAFEGTLTDLKTISIDNVLIEVDDLEKAVQILSAKQGYNPKIINNKISISLNERDKTAAAVFDLASGGIKVYSVVENQKSLEELFFDITIN
ncbi:MAG: ATP-binding cassette domain-containing protein [Melioribacteraceae bacterium]|nr:ATP-binding cassette domain-containing protein [Melioribacteraceae bacterium]MCF8263053.1 ATP-binding cassette domain-containing protein [Melioribacteraceae bacterium]MCF8431255.1 ATP-binding cassette domain-containing protein [Melioribacteraceae bacterium]